MKKLITLLLLFLSLTSFGQLTISHSIVPKTTYKVGDTIQVKYTVSKGTNPIITPRYFWLRYQFNNKALSYVGTTWSQGTSVQTFYTGWSNYKFTPNTTNGKLASNLYEQYQSTPWNYSVNSNWNAGQLTVQRTDASIDGDIATQKYIIKDLNDYDDIHKLDLAYSIDAAGTNVSSVGSTSGIVSLVGVKGNTSQFKVRVLFPSGYDITAHSVSLIPLKTTGEIDWTGQSIATKQLDASGEVIFTTETKVGDSFAVFVNAASEKSFMNNVVTVSDAYKAFLGISQTDISGVANYFTYSVLEKKIGLITKNKTTFSESDSYYMFAYVMGIDVSPNASVPTNAAPVNQTVNFKWNTGLLNQSWLDGIATYKTTVTSSNQAVDMVYAWGGDLDWSHSSSPTEIASRIASGNYANSVKTMNRTISTSTMSYALQTLETAKLSITSKLEGGKVILTTNLTKTDLAGLQVIMNYDDSKLTLDKVIFDAGSTITNFSTHDNGRLTFGSIDQLKTARIKTGTPYTLVFTPKTTLTNTSGLFYFVLSDAVDAKGNKINLIVE
jgi:hypothetical protein